MAKLILEIDDGVIHRVHLAFQSAFAQQYAVAKEADAAIADEDFTTQRLVAFVRDVTAAVEGPAAAEIARKAAVDKVNAEIAITGSTDVIKIP